jgi:hypothetical protein
MRRAHRLAPHERERSDLPSLGSDDRAPTEDERAGGHVRARVADVLPRGHLRERLHAELLAGRVRLGQTGVLDHDDRIRAPGEGRAGVDSVKRGRRECLATWVRQGRHNRVRAGLVGRWGGWMWAV